MLDNATKLSNSFMKNEMDYDLKLPEKEEENLYKDYYLKTCAYINENHHIRPNIKLIEDVLNGVYIPENRLYGVICSVDDKELRKYLFKSAMAKQLIYDMENGRTSMQRIDQSYSVCPEFKQNLSLLGFIKTGMYSRAGN